MTDFKREERYLVIKISKLSRHPEFRERVIAVIKQAFSGALVDCVVVERDWPEYEPVWRMIEDRASGALTATGGRDELDAKRYRWLREQCKTHNGLTIAKVGTWDLTPWSGDNPDARIDAAIAAAQPAQEKENE